LDSVGIAEKWVDSAINVERHSERVLILKMVRQWFIKCSYGLCSSLRKTRGGKGFLERSASFDDLYTSE